MNKKIISLFSLQYYVVIMTNFFVGKGTLEIGFIDLFRGLFTGKNEDVEIIKDLRFPRIIIALFTVRR